MAQIKHRGLRYYRCKTNPEEKRFAQEWEKVNNHEGVRHYLLEYMLGDGQTSAIADQQAATLAATVIQWLGSTVGQSFLREVGYERVTDKEKKNVVKTQAAAVQLLAYSAAQALLRKALAFSTAEEKKT